MFTTEDRNLCYNKTIEFFQTCALFEGILQIGSGTFGYRDEYSDIDLMAAYFNKEDTLEAKDAVKKHFSDLGAVYMDERKWTETILGVSAFFENGLNVDLSFGPTHELVICSPQWKIALDKTGELTKHIEKVNEEFENHYSNYGIDNSIHHKFIYAIRTCSIALKRNNFIYACSQLNEARQYVLNIQVLNEGKKLHQFKAYNTLNNDFQEAIAQTFPTVLSLASITETKDKLFNLYFEVLKINPSLTFDNNLLVLLKI